MTEYTVCCLMVDVLRQAGLDVADRPSSTDQFVRMSPAHLAFWRRILDIPRQKGIYTVRPIPSNIDTACVISEEEYGKYMAEAARLPH